MPNSTQLARVAVLATIRASAEATLTTTLAALTVAQNNYDNAPTTANSAALTTAFANLAAAEKAYRNAAHDHSEYNSYAFTTSPRSNVIDTGPGGL